MRIGKIRLICCKGFELFFNKTLQQRKSETDDFQSTGIKQCLPAWFLFIEKPCGMQAYTSTACIINSDGELMSRHYLMRTH